MGDANVLQFQGSVTRLQDMQGSGVGGPTTQAAIARVLDSAAKNGMDAHTIRAADESIAGLRNATDPGGVAARKAIVNLRNATADSLGSWSLARGEAAASAMAWGVNDLLRP